MRLPKRTILIAGVAVTLAAGGTLAANATWSIPGKSAPVKLTTVDMPRGAKPSVSKKGDGAIVTWSPQEIAPGTAMQAYVVTRHDADDASSLKVFAAVPGTTLTDAEVPAGKFYWTVTPRFAAWIGEESQRSENLKFSAPAAAARTAAVTGAAKTGPGAPTAAPTQTAGGGGETADPPPAPAPTTEAPPENDPPPVEAPVETAAPPPVEASGPGDAGQL
jgi:hypothetical protein